MKHSKSSLFLMELIIAILFFALASTVCIRLFTKSHLLSNQTVNQNEAVLKAQNLAEMYLSCHDFDTLVTLCEPSLTSPEQGLLYFYYDKDWKPVDSVAAGGFIVEMHGKLDAEGNPLSQSEPSETPDSMQYMRIYVFQVQKHELTDNTLEQCLDCLYHLSLCKHIPERRGNLEKK